MDEATGTSRRSLLGRGLLLAAGAIGISAARFDRPALGAVPTKQGDARLRLYGRNFHLHAGSAPAGRSRRKAIATARTGSCSTGRTARSSGTSRPRT